jgi:hypothetical protein
MQTPTATITAICKTFQIEIGYARAVGIKGDHADVGMIGLTPEDRSDPYESFSRP